MSRKRVGAALVTALTAVGCTGHSKPLSHADFYSAVEQAWQPVSDFSADIQFGPTAAAPLFDQLTQTIDGLSALPDETQYQTRLSNAANATAVAFRNVDITDASAGMSELEEVVRELPTT